MISFPDAISDLISTESKRSQHKQEGISMLSTFNSLPVMA